MFRVKTPTMVLSMAFLATSLGCSASRTHEVIGGHVDDEVITTQVQTAIDCADDVGHPRKERGFH